MKLAQLTVIASTIALLAQSAPAFAGWSLDGKGKVTFSAQGSPGALDIKGKGDDLALSDDGTTIVASVVLDSVSTGIDLRDDHMKHEFLLIDTFPKATISFAKDQIQLPTEVGQATNGTVAATFNVHGVDAPVTVAWSIRKSKTGYLVDASFDYDASANGIEIPSYLGITVDPKQKASVRFSMLDG